jgi:redox-sensitive bicupin YhaK (pirin superfamily)
MSGPVAPEDTDAPDAVAAPPVPALELSDSRLRDVGGTAVHRALPQSRRRTIGAWCFLDHFGPDDAGMGIGPHPHTGLQTVTWLVAGEVVHHDSLGSEQLIRPGQLNLMTAGHGVAHAEEAPETHAGPTHGVQLWVALPEATRHGPPAFEHHPQLPRMGVGTAIATVIVGGLAGERSPARADTPLLGAEVVLRGGEVDLPLDPAFEHGLVVLEGGLSLDGVSVGSTQLAYLRPGRERLRIASSDAARALLIGGAPFAETPLMWWNFVARTREEVGAATREWNAGSARFGEVASTLSRIPAPPPPW